MSTSYWEALYESLTTEGANLAWRPTVADLDNYENEYKCRLPLGYREFITTFGPGKLAIVLSLASPGYPDKNSFYSLEFFQEMRESPEYWPPEHKDRIARLVTFGLYSSENLVAWDPSEETDSTKPDFTYWEVRPDNKLHFRGETFKECIDYFSEMLFANDNDPDASTIGPWRSFRHATNPFS